jgi:hypothetical protein
VQGAEHNANALALIRDFTVVGTITIAHTAMTTAGSMVVWSGAPFIGGTGWVSCNEPVPLTVLLKDTPGFAPAVPLQVVSEVGNETNFPTEKDLREMEADEFLDGVYARISSGHVPAATDAVIDHLDRLLNDGLFGECDRLLARANLHQMPSNVRRAFLAVTRPAKQELPTRAVFYNEALRLSRCRSGRFVR